MNSELQTMCLDFMEYQTIFRQAFMWSGYRQVFPLASYICLNHRDEPNSELLSLCKKILKENSGVFSAFRSTGRVIFTALLSTDIDPGARMERAAEAYEQLRDYFSSSAYLPLLAMIMAKNARVGEYSEIAAKTKEIYHAMNDYHVFLTGREDTVFAGLMALKERDIEDLMDETEDIYEWLQEGSIFGRNANQTLSHALVLCEGNWESKCRRMKTLIDDLKSTGLKVGKGFEIIPLAILANVGVDVDVIVSDLLAVDSWLARQEGYGVFGHNRKKRLMHAAMIVAAYHMSGSYELSCAVIICELLDIEAQQAAAAAA